MNAQETLELLKALKNCGATHFKSQDFEVHMGTAALHEPLITPPPVVVPAQEQPLSPPTVENAEATEKLKGLIESLKMDDHQLINKIFPAGAEI